MARNDGIDRTSVRNLAVSDKAVSNTQQHNEREKDSYRNPDIIPQRAAWNVHFKKPTASYTDLFAQLEADGTISTRGLKPDATHYCELVFDVNSAYFDNHGGYEFAKQFYEDAYKAAVQIVGGEQYILSAVMHADEINRAMTEALGREVYHYHLHVVYVPVVEKQILWSKRCKDKALVGAVKETVMQVSRSKKWAPKTYQSNLALIQNLIIPYIGEMQMQKLRPYHIEALYDTLSKTPCGQYVGGKRRDLSPKQQKRTLSGTTLHEVHQLLHNSFLLAVEWGILIKSPVPVEAPKKTTQERSIWEVDEMRAALDSMEDPILHLAVHLTLVGALREGEVVGLTPEDIDFGAADGMGTITINKSIQRVQKDTPVRICW